MEKTAVVLLTVLLLLFSSTATGATNVDLSTMSYSELLTLQKEVGMAIRSVEPVDGSLIYDHGDIRVYFIKIVEDISIGAKFQIENASNRDVSVTFENVSVNDFMMSTLFFSTVMSGKKAIDTLDFLYLNDYGISEIDNIELKVSIVDATSFSSIDTSDTISINP